MASLIYFAIGDVHGESRKLGEMHTAILDRIAFEGAPACIIHLGDYVDRGPDSAGVVARLRRLPEQTVGKVVFLRGNHEDALLRIIDGGDPGFLMPPGNGVAATFRSFTDTPPGDLSREEFVRYFDLDSWMPPAIVRWMRDLPLWYRDSHAIYVHAGLEGEGAVWNPPETSSAHSLLWMREPDFFAEYAGPPLVFGHTPVMDLPPADGWRTDPWRRGPLIGIDTGAGKGGPLTCIELPGGDVFQAFPGGGTGVAGSIG
jgi:serine/threonine protein phosphatase 1